MLKTPCETYLDLSLPSHDILSGILHGKHVALLPKIVVCMLVEPLTFDLSCIFVRKFLWPQPSS